MFTYQYTTSTTDKYEVMQTCAKTTPLRPFGVFTCPSMLVYCFKHYGSKDSQDSACPNWKKGMNVQNLNQKLCDGQWLDYSIHNNNPRGKEYLKDILKVALSL